ncbi:surface glycoprotein, partial [Halostagnicola sp. A-GB9-2]|uniref:surface glycoprotein n=1 Tax=Halostagnicola sp. A-GB9-2 TaxID=3048066 RepID=UPI0024BF84E5
MTNENSYREKGRALFLAVMMVLSVVAMSAAFAGAAAAHNHSYDDDGPTYETGDTIDEVWIGQEVTIEEDDDSGIEVYEGLNPSTGDDSPITTLRVDSDNEATLDTENLEAGEPYTLESSSWSDESFWALEEELDIDFDSSSVYEEDDDVTIDFESERNDFMVNVTEDSLDEDELGNLFVETGAVDEINTEYDDVAILTIEDIEGNNEEISADFSDSGIEAGDYDFNFNVTDSLAEENASIEVTEDDEDIEFVDIDSVEEGEIGNITIDAGNAGEAAFSFGDRDENHVVNMSLDIDEDEVVLEHNTHLAGVEEGSDAEEEAGNAGWTAHNASITDFDMYTELGDDEILPAETWDLEIGEDADETGVESSTFIDESHDRDLFTIGDRSAPSDAVTQTAPHDDDVEDLDDYD